MKPKRSTRINDPESEVRKLEDETMSEMMIGIEKSLQNTIKESESYRIRLQLSENRVMELERQLKRVSDETRKNNEAKMIEVNLLKEQHICMGRHQSKKKR